MKKQIHNRKHIRLKNYNYKSNAYYFITICSYKRQNYFSAIDYNSNLIYKQPAKLINSSLKYLDNNYAQVLSYVIMPNHIHMILELYNSKYSLSYIISRFKSYTANQFRKKYNKKLWQRNFHEKIIRTDKQYLALIRYIEENPRKWSLDKYYIDS